MILVMPDGGVSFYVNNHDSPAKYDVFFHAQRGAEP
jgi:hypothetical protein